MTTKIDIADFMSRANSLAARLSDERLPGLISRRLEVPDDALVFASYSDGTSKLLAAGTEVASGDFDGVMVKTRAFDIDFEFDGLRSRDSLDLTARMRMSFAFGTQAFDLEAFWKNLLGARDDYSRSDLYARLQPGLLEAMKGFTSARSAQDLCESDMRQPVRDMLTVELKRVLFDAGIVLQKIHHPSFESEAHDELRRQEADARIAAEELEQEQRLEDLKKRLEADGIMRDLELRGELDRRRSQDQIERWKDLRKQMGDDDAKALICLLDDDDLRQQLIHRLAQQDLPQEDRHALASRQLEERLGKQLNSLQTKLAELTGVQLGPSSQRGPSTRRLLCVVGKKVLAYDPTTNLNPEVPKEVYDTETGSLGYLRSVRFQRLRGKEVILAGAQKGIYLLQDGAEPREFPFDSEPRGHGGANSACTLDKHIYATHSELGVVCWDETGISRSRILFDDVTDQGSATRGACLSPDGKLYFSSGPNIHAADVVRGDADPVTFSGSSESITSFAVGRRELFAGNKYGTILRWDLNDPRSPRELPVRKSNPIYMLRLFEAGGQQHLVIGSKDFSVTVASVDDDQFKEYRAREEIRWVDAAADRVYGVSRAGYKVFIWEPLRTTEPSLTIRVSDKIQDIWVVRERMRTHS